MVPRPIRSGKQPEKPHQIPQQPRPQALLHSHACPVAAAARNDCSHTDSNNTSDCAICQVHTHEEATRHGWLGLLCICELHNPHPRLDTPAGRHKLADAVSKSGAKELVTLSWARATISSLAQIIDENFERVLQARISGSDAITEEDVRVINRAGALMRRIMPNMHSTKGDFSIDNEDTLIHVPDRDGQPDRLSSAEGQKRDFAADQKIWEARRAMQGIHDFEDRVSKDLAFISAEQQGDQSPFYRENPDIWAVDQANIHEKYLQQKYSEAERAATTSMLEQQLRRPQGAQEGQQQQQASPVVVDGSTPFRPRSRSPLCQPSRRRCARWPKTVVVSPEPGPTAQKQQQNVKATRVDYREQHKMKLALIDSMDKQERQLRAQQQSILAYPHVSDHKWFQLSASEHPAPNVLDPRSLTSFPSRASTASYHQPAYLAYGSGLRNLGMCDPAAPQEYQYHQLLYQAGIGPYPEHQAQLQPAPADRLAMANPPPKLTALDPTAPKENTHVPQRTQLMDPFGYPGSGPRMGERETPWPASCASGDTSGSHIRRKPLPTGPCMTPAQMASLHAQDQRLVQAQPVPANLSPMSLPSYHSAPKPPPTAAEPTPPAPAAREEQPEEAQPNADEPPSHSPWAVWPPEDIGYLQFPMDESVRAQLMDQVNQVRMQVAAVDRWSSLQREVIEIAVAKGLKPLEDPLPTSAEEATRRSRRLVEQLRATPRLVPSQRRLLRDYEMGPGPFVAQWVAVAQAEHAAAWTAARESAAAVELTTPWTFVEPKLSPFQQPHGYMNAPYGAVHSRDRFALMQPLPEIPPPIRRRPAFPKGPLHGLKKDDLAKAQPSSSTTTTTAAKPNPPSVTAPRALEKGGEGGARSSPEVVLKSRWTKPKTSPGGNDVSMKEGVDTTHQTQDKGKGKEKENAAAVPAKRSSSPGMARRTPWTEFHDVIMKEIDDPHQPEGKGKGKEKEKEKEKEKQQDPPPRQQLQARQLDGHIYYTFLRTPAPVTKKDGEEEEEIVVGAPPPSTNPSASDPEPRDVTMEDFLAEAYQPENKGKGKGKPQDPPGVYTRQIKGETYTFTKLPDPMTKKDHTQEEEEIVGGAPRSTTPSISDLKACDVTTDDLFHFENKAKGKEKQRELPMSPVHRYATIKYHPPPCYAPRHVEAQRSKPSEVPPEKNLTPFVDLVDHDDYLDSITPSSSYDFGKATKTGGATTGDAAPSPPEAAQQEQVKVPQPSLGGDLFDGIYAAPPDLISIFPHPSGQHPMSDVRSEPQQQEDNNAPQPSSTNPSNENQDLSDDNNEYLDSATPDPSYNFDWPTTQDTGDAADDTPQASHIKHAHQQDQEEENTPQQPQSRTLSPSSNPSTVSWDDVMDMDFDSVFPSTADVRRLPASPDARSVNGWMNVVMSEDGESSGDNIEL